MIKNLEEQKAKTKAAINKNQAKTAVKEAVYLYNTRRPHKSLDYKTPEKMHRIAA